MTIIFDGAGGCGTAQVYSDNKLAARAVVSTAIEEATGDGRAFNINTGWISAISADSALLYFYNDDIEDFVLSSIAVGLKDGSATDVQGVYIVSNPTGGTLVSAATDCDMISNRRVQDAKTFTSGTKIYKATASGQTLTGGSDSALFAQNDQGRLFASIGYVIPRGTAFGIRLEVLGSFNGDVYAALIGHKEKVL